MSQIQFLTPAQAELIPDIQEKWRRIYLSTQPLDQIRAVAAIKGAYAVMGQPEPEVVFCSSPRAALEYLQDYVAQVEVPQADTTVSPEAIQASFFKHFGQAVFETFRLKNKQQQSGIRPITDLLGKLSHRPYKLLAKHIEHCLPKDLTTQDVVEQAFIGAIPLFEQLGKTMAREGDPEFSKTLQDRPMEDWQESFSQTASAIETQLGWLPGKGFLFRGWLKKMVQSTLAAKITGVNHPQLQEAVQVSFLPAEQLFLLENPFVTNSGLAVACIWLDFAFSVLGYPHDAQKWAALQGLVKYCGDIFAVKNLCVVCDRPTKILLNEDSQLHGEGEPALEFADGFAAYAYHGTRMPEQYGTVHPNQWQAQWVLEERYRDLKRVLIRGIGAVRLCQELPVIQLDTVSDYALLKLEGIDDHFDRILKRTDPETGDIQAIFVRWHERSVRSALHYIHQNYATDNFPIPDDTSSE